MMHNPRFLLRRLVGSVRPIAFSLVATPFLLILLGLGTGQTARAQPLAPGPAPGADAGPWSPVATQVSIDSISVACNTSTGGFTGTVTLSGNSTATITLGVFFHTPASPVFFDTGVHTTVTFTGGNTANYSFASVVVPGANTYRIQVVDADGLGGGTTKSDSVPACIGATPTITPTNTPTGVPTASATTTATPSAPQTGTTTATPSPTPTGTTFVPVGPTNTPTATPTGAAPATSATPTATHTAVPTSPPGAPATATPTPAPSGGGQATATPTGAAAAAAPVPATPTALPRTVVSAAPVRPTAVRSAALPKAGGFDPGVLGLLAASAVGLGWYLRNHRNRRP